MRNYALEKEKSGLSAEDAWKESETSFQRLLPDGKDSKGQFLYAIVEEAQGEKIGTFWLGMQKQGSELVPWVYEIELEEKSRGKGYGKATMLAAEAKVKELGYNRLDLHVFGHNQVARKLYESLGYKATSVVMRKDL